MSRLLVVEDQEAFPRLLDLPPPELDRPLKQQLAEIAHAVERRAIIAALREEAGKPDEGRTEVWDQPRLAVQQAQGAEINV